MDSPPQQHRLKQLRLEQPELEQAIDQLLRRQEAQLHRVSTWLASLHDCDCGQTPPNHQQDYQTSETRGSAMLPHTPPASAHASSAPAPAAHVESGTTGSAGIRNASPSKRPMHDALPDLDETPKVLRGRLMLQPVSPRKGRRQSSSPSHSPVKSTLDLGLLEKPVTIAKLRANFGRLPSDIQVLVESVEGLRYHTPFIPMEIRSEVSSIMARDGEGDPKSSWFMTAFEEKGGRQAALEELGTLLDVRHESLNASKFRKYEAAWNTAVHHPLLKLAFDDSSEQRRAEERIRLGLGSDPARKSVHIRVENITNGTVTGDCVPCLRDDMATGDEQTEEHVFIPAWSLHSLSTSSTTSSSTGSSLGDEADAVRPAPSLALRKTGHKKVDFAIVVDPEPGSSLHTIIEGIRLAMLRDTGMPWLTSINPSNYGPLREALVAGIVETKVTTASTDPIIQLSLMVAAIHRRLHTLPVQGAVGPSAISKTGVLPPWLLLAITDHRWELFFACDGGSKIDVIGPLKLGTTDSLLECYELLASLRLLKAWIQSSFCPALETWLSSGPST